MQHHFYRARYNWEKVVHRINSSPHLTPENKKIILEFGDFCLAEGLSFARALKYVEQLHTIGKLVEVTFDAARKKDIEVLMRKVETAGYTDSYRHDLKVTIKKFYKWMNGGEQYPECVRWILSGLHLHHKLPEALLTEEDVRKMILAMEHVRDRALIAVLYDSGCRIGEIGTMQVKHTVFDEHGAYIIVTGKTGMRRVRLILSVPYVASWIDLHPQRQDPDAPLWMNVGTYARYRPMSYEAMKIVVDRAAKRAGIKKRVYPHLFRHSRATALADKLTEAQLKEMFGWTQSSRQAATYIHLSGRNVDDALLRLNGLKRETTLREESPLRLRTCTRCEKQNPATSTICNRCGCPLTTEEAMKAESARREWDDVMSKLVADPEVQAILVQKLREIGLQLPD